MSATPLARPADLLRRADPRRVALAILIAGLIVRALVCFALVPWFEAATGAPPAPDCYPDLARTLLHEGELGFGDAGATPTTVRGPGFPLWLAGGMLTAGYDNRWLAFWGSLPGIFAAAAVAGFLTGRLGATAGLSGGLIAAAHPLPAFISGRVMSDEFYGVCALAAILLLPLALEETTSALAAGTALGWHLLVRSTGVLTLVVVLAALAALIRARRKAGRPAARLIPLLLFLSIGLVPAAAWSVRTSALEGRPVWVNSQLGYNYWIGRGFDAHPEARSPGEAWSNAVATVRAAAGEEAAHPLDAKGYYGLTPPQAARLDRVLREAALRDLSADPTGFLGRSARGLLKFWYATAASGRSVPYFLCALPVLALAALGALSLIRASSRASLAGLTPPIAGPVLVALIAFIALHQVCGATIFPMARFSVQVYPALALLAGAGAQAAFGTLVRRSPEIPPPA